LDDDIHQLLWHLSKALEFAWDDIAWQLENLISDVEERLPDGG
jgi:hypothetical protein